MPVLPVQAAWVFYGAPTTICQYPGCQSDAFRNPDGTYSLFCSKAHRDVIQRHNVARSAGGNGRLCKNCQLRPVYVEGNRIYDFCGQRCRGEYQASAGNANGTELCLRCRKKPKVIINGKLSDFCSNSCKQDTFASAPLLLKVDKDTESFRDVSKQFSDKWAHPKPTPTVIKIWKIYCSANHTTKFMSYKLAVERNTGQARGNSRRRWHGTFRACTVGDNDNQATLCQNTGCSLCRIMESSFHVMKSRKGALGTGIYTSATSSKSNGYVAEGGGSPYKAMLLSDVVLGRTYKLKSCDSSITQPPTGYDSVVGEPGAGSSFGYDEAVVYTDEAVRPLFLIIYDG